MRSRAISLAIAVVALALPAGAGAAWLASGGSGSSYAKARTVATGSTPTTSVSGRNVTVSWTASGSVPADGYVVKRYADGGGQQSIGDNCAGTVAGLSCTENGVPPGSWRYTVTPHRNNWSGAESAQSGVAVVAQPSLSLSPSTVSSLPADLTGNISSFKTGQTVSFRLDDPTTGTVLAGSIVPSPVPGDGSASVTVTIPSGTANGAHTVYAIGNQGDTASAPVTVAVPATIPTSAWDVRDASGGGSESNQSEVDAFANDGRTATDTFGLSFSTSRYLQFDLNAPLVPGRNVSSPSFNFNFSASGILDNACFYFEVRRASTNAVIGTHGSAGSPVACQGGSLTSTSTSIPEVSTTNIANDLRIRVFASNGLLFGGLTRDLATVSGTTAGTSFTLYDSITTNAADGSPVTSPWGLAAAGDGAVYQSLSQFTSAFSASRYLKLTFPAYVPSGATISAVELKHAYRPATAANACYYVEIYQGGTLIGSHGSTASPVSCNGSTSTFATDTISLPEVNSVARANAVTARLYFRGTTAAVRSQSDLAELRVTFVD